ncbi:MAG: trp operon repressor [Patescibacteria group bacterium]|nr:trp operon repressor [Patescibacteria group bacterium]
MSKPKTERLVNVPDELLRELLTDSEWRMVKQRLLILNLLEEGLSIRRIAEEANVGTDTVVRVARMAEKKNLRKILNKKNTNSAPTPWVFGKTEKSS